MTMKNVKMLSLVLSCVLVLLLASCTKDPIAGNYPKNVTVTYRITSPSGGITTVTSGSYTNETGGTTSLNNIALPYTKTISRTVNRGDALSVGFLHNNTGSGSAFSIKLEILVDNKVVTTETYSSTSATIGAVAHVFQ